MIFLYWKQYLYFYEIRSLTEFKASANFSGSLLKQPYNMYEHTIISDRDRLIRENIALVNRVVNYLKPRTPPHIDKDDMLQVGTLGLISAADSYDADRYKIS